MQGVVKDPLHICRWGKEGEPLSEKEAEVSPRGGEIGLQCCVKWTEKTPCDDPRAQPGVLRRGPRWQKAVGPRGLPGARSPPGDEIGLQCFQRAEPPVV